jgi:hypothetical protein
MKLPHCTIEIRESPKYLSMFEGRVKIESAETAQYGTPIIHSISVDMCIAICCQKMLDKTERLNFELSETFQNQYGWSRKSYSTSGTLIEVVGCNVNSLAHSDTL